ncbi:MAG: hypothetical protein HY549_01200 [Elusimicrobia bacterium]|nr:hypothetical protein [Elusimicrobiota bacterium]
MKGRRLALAAGLALSAGCSPRAYLNPNYDLGRVRRIAVWRFDSNQKSAIGAEDLFNRSLLENGFQVVERAQLEAVIQEQKLGKDGVLAPRALKKVGNILGVDALLLGSVTYTPERKEVVKVAVPHRIEEPVFETIREKLDDGSARETHRQIGTRVRHEHNVVPQVFNIHAQVGIVAKLVDVETGEIIWVGSDSTEGPDALSAAESAAYYLVRTLRKQWTAAASTRRLNR